MPSAIQSVSRDDERRHRDEAVAASFSFVIGSALPPYPNAIDTAIGIATDVLTDRSARYRARPEHDACPGNATHRIFNVLAVHDRPGWRWIESDASKPQQDAGSNPGNSR